MGQPQRARAPPDLYLLLNGRSEATPTVVHHRGNCALFLILCTPLYCRVKPTRAYTSRLAPRLALAGDLLSSQT